MAFRHTGPDGDTHTHEEAAVARLCSLGLTFPCGEWFYAKYELPAYDAAAAAADEGYDEGYASMAADFEGGEYVAECGAPAWENARGWKCENGHEHISMEAQAREGWVMAESQEEADALASYGFDARARYGGNFTSERDLADDEARHVYATTAL